MKGFEFKTITLSLLTYQRRNRRANFSTSKIPVWSNYHVLELSDYCLVFPVKEMPICLEGDKVNGLRVSKFLVGRLKVMSHLVSVAGYQDETVHVDQHCECFVRDRGYICRP